MITLIAEKFNSARVTPSAPASFNPLRSTRRFNVFIVTFLRLQDGDRSEQSSYTNVCDTSFTIESKQTNLHDSPKLSGSGVANFSDPSL